MNTASSARTHQWLSQDFEALQKHCEQSSTLEHHYDLVIVGSGYGGAMAAAQLAGSHCQGEAMRIAVVERGREYLPGMFPSSMSSLPGHFRLLTAHSSHLVGNREGLFDVRMSESAACLCANGLGGSSLIDSGVMQAPKASIFDEQWPTPLRYSETAELLDEYLPQAKQLLGASDSERRNTISRHPSHQKKPLSKTIAAITLFDNMVRQGATPQPQHAHQADIETHESGAYPNPVMTSLAKEAALAISLHPHTNRCGVKMDACNLCGDCALGCNFNAKQSLDTHLLVQAHNQGVDIYTGVSVTRLMPLSADDASRGWVLQSVATAGTDASKPVQNIKAKKVILAAGSLGSTEILLKSQSEHLQLSSQLGQGFSGNGYQQASIYDQHQAVNAVADESKPAEERRVGPTTTIFSDLNGSAGRIQIQEQSSPSALHRLNEELLTTLDCVSQLAQKDTSQHLDGRPDKDPWQVDPDKIQRTSIYTMLGDDGAEGSFALAPEYTAALSDSGSSATQRQLLSKQEGLLRPRWPGLADIPLFKAQLHTLRQLQQQADIGGGIQSLSIMGSPVNTSDSAEISNGSGLPLTTQPLGGCAMADDASNGVVDHCGRVFNCSSHHHRSAVFDNLVVLDAATIPTALGTNPALTIAALALRATDYLRTQWLWQKQRQTADNLGNDTTPPYPIERPSYHQLQPLEAEQETEIEITERFWGDVALTDNQQKPIDCTIDITLQFEPKSVIAITRRGDRNLRVKRRADNTKAISQIRILRREHWQELVNAGASDEEFTLQALLVAPLSGSVELMSRENSTYVERVLRAGGGWLLNTGINQGLRHIGEWFRREFSPPQQKVNALQKRQFARTRDNQGARRAWNAFLGVTSRSGEVRLSHYRLHIEKPDSGWPSLLQGFSSQNSSLPLSAFKRLHYGYASNPIQQLDTLHLELLPGLQPPRKQPHKKPVELRGDINFLLQERTPAVRVVKQQNQIRALSDLMTLFAYFGRGLLSVHHLNFLPSKPSQHSQTPQFPGTIYSGPSPQVTQIRVANSRNKQSVSIRLSHYPQKHRDNKPPLVLIHGFSSSGAIFTHPSLKPSMVEFFWLKGREVWVVDLRTSAAFDSAQQAWHFDEVAFSDIPVAIDHICRSTQSSHVDVFAHCMGAAMLGMAILAQPKAGDTYYHERQQLPQRIHRLVLSQGGPRFVFTPENLTKIRYLLPLANVLPKAFYHFKRATPPSPSEALWDRLASILPYPQQDHRRHNPWWPSGRDNFTNNRQRLDALYGQTFNLHNMSQETLSALAELFGPLNLQTLVESCQFGLRERITNRQGQNEYLTIERLRQRWSMTTLSQHSDDNRVIDVATLSRMQTLMGEADRDFHTQILKGYGHLDVVIGRNAESNFERVREFLDHPCKLPEPRPEALRYNLFAPVAGPIMAPVNEGKLPLGLGFSRAMSKPECVLFLPVSFAEKGQLKAFYSGQSFVENKGHVDIKKAALHSTESVPLSAEWLRQQAHLCLVPSHSQNWLKLQLPLTAAMRAASGILAIVIDDLGLADEPLNTDTLPDNLFTLFDEIDSPSTVDKQHNGHSPASSSRSQYTQQLQQKLMGDSFLQRLEDYLAQGYHKLHNSLIELPQDTQPEQVQMVLGSCQFPGSRLDELPAYASYQRLSQRLQQQARSSLAQLKPSLLLLTGEQVYLSARSYMLGGGRKLQSNKAGYMQWLSKSAVQATLRRLPTLTLMNQHEISAPTVATQGSSPQSPAHLLARSKTDFFNFQRPDSPFLPAPEQAYQMPLWGSRRHQGFDLFLLDTCTDRLLPSAQLNKQQLISDTQFQALEQWLLRSQTQDLRPRFIVSSAALLPRSRAVKLSNSGSSSWSQFPQSFECLLQFIATHRCHNLVFLSGDTHVSSLVRAELKSPHLHRPVRFYSIHSSALYAPFPHANAKPMDFIEKEKFIVDGELEELNCSVDTQWHPGDGFALVSAYKLQGRWTVEAEFDRDKDGKPPERLILDSPLGGLF